MSTFKVGDRVSTRYGYGTVRSGPDREGDSTVRVEMDYRVRPRVPKYGNSPRWRRELWLHDCKVKPLPPEDDPKRNLTSGQRAFIRFAKTPILITYGPAWQWGPIP